MKLSKDHRTMLELLVANDGRCLGYIRHWANRYCGKKNGCPACPIYIHDDKCTTKKAKTRAISRLLEDEMDL